MAIFRQNFSKPTTTTRALKRDRRSARKSKARQTGARHLAKQSHQAFNYHAKQSRRWLKALLLSENRGFLTKEAALQLGKHLEKTEDQLRHPRITDAVLFTDAQRALSQLELEREAAKREQGYPERVQDWWAPPTMVGKKKRKKGMTVGGNQGATADGGGIGEGLGNEEMDEEEGGVLLEEEHQGSQSPIMMSPGGSQSPVVMSPVGSVGGDEGEEEEEEEEEEEL